MSSGDRRYEFPSSTDHLASCYSLKIAMTESWKSVVEINVIVLKASSSFSTL